MKFSLALLSLVPVLASLAVAPAAARQCAPPPRAPDAALAAQIDPIVEAALAEGFAGGVALIENGAFVYNRVAGAADLAGDIPVTEETLFHVASISKYFTAALMLKAAEDGVVDLDAPVAPLAAGTTLAARGVTFADLLAHRSGLGSSYAAEDTNDPRETLELIDAAGIDEDRAGGFRYSNDGYNLLGVFLEQLYGAPYEDIARDKLVEPACLSHVGFWGEVDTADPTVLSQPAETIPQKLRKRNYGLLSSGGLLISAADLAAWQYALTDGAVLSEASLEALYAPRGTVRIGQAAYGVFLIDHPELGRVISARGYEDWGDNAYLNHYTACGVIFAVTTSRGPLEKTGKRPFRVTIAEQVEAVLEARCKAGE